MISQVNGPFIYFLAKSSQGRKMPLQKRIIEISCFCHPTKSSSAFNCFLCSLKLKLRGLLSHFITPMHFSMQFDQVVTEEGGEIQTDTVHLP